MTLLCPKCHQTISLHEKCFRCVNNHCYDVAKGGYVNLVLHNRKSTGDDKGMVEARTNFLAKGYYQSLQVALCKQIQSLAPHVLIDAGCGEGYYTNAIKQICQNTKIYGFDLSKFALKQACKAHRGVQYVSASVADVPLQDASADGWVSVFAPIYIEEVKRVLTTNGYFIKVGPGLKHLYELKQELYDSVYDNDCAITTYDGFVHLTREYIEDEIDVDNQEDIHALLQMTPYYYRSLKEKVVALTKKNCLHTRLEFTIDIYQKQ